MFPPVCLHRRELPDCSRSRSVGRGGGGGGAGDKGARSLAGRACSGSRPGTPRVEPPSLRTRRSGSHAPPLARFKALCELPPRNRLWGVDHPSRDLDTVHGHLE